MTTDGTQAQTNENNNNNQQIVKQQTNQMDTKLQRKQNLSSFDVAQLVSELQSHLVNTRINSFVNVNKGYLMKIAVSSKGLQECGIKISDVRNEGKDKVLIVPGIRMNITRFEQQTSKASEAAKQIRSRIVGKLILGINQLNIDRTIIIAIGSSQVNYYLIVELYGKGNLILTDEHLVVLACQNSYRTCRTGTQYKISACQSQSWANVSALKSVQLNDFKSVLAGPPSHKPKKKHELQLRHQLAQHFYLGGAAASIIIRTAGLATGIKTEQLQGKALETVYNLTMQVLSLQIGNVELAQSQQTPGFVYYYPEGMIRIDESLKSIVNAEVIRALSLAEFYPINLVEIFTDLYPANCVQKYDSFNEAVDNYFVQLCSCQQYSGSIELVAKKQVKHAAVLDVNEAKVNKLLLEANQLRLKGKIVQYHDEFVDSYVSKLQQAFHTKKLSFNTIAKQLADGSNPLLDNLASVDLVTKVFELQLPVLPEMTEQLGYEDFSDILEQFGLLDEDYDDESLLDGVVISVPFQLNQSVGKIYSMLFDSAKQCEEKAQKTEAQASTALENIKQKHKIVDGASLAAQQEENIQNLQIFNKQQQLNWFEKFHWFISSDGILVVGGKDASSNDILIKRHLELTDIFVHADFQGAPCVLVKCGCLYENIESFEQKSDENVDSINQNDQYKDLKKQSKMIVPPQRTLEEAAALSALCTQSWNIKAAPPKAYYVQAWQVSKTAPTGQSLSTGGFVIRGQRSYLTPSSNYLGITLLWRYQSIQKQFINKLQEFKETFQPKIIDIEGNEAEQSGKDVKDNDVTMVVTKKQSQQRETVEDAKKQAHKQERKEAKAQRQAKIKEQKFQAKMKRLEKEKKFDVIEAIKQQKQNTLEQTEKFCIFCQSQEHFYTECTETNRVPSELKEDVRVYVPPILLKQFNIDINAVKQQKSKEINVKYQEADSSDMEEVQESENDECSQEGQEDVVEPEMESSVRIQSQYPEYKFSTEFIKDDVIGCAAMIGPISALEGYERLLRIRPDGNTQRGQSYKKIQEIYKKMLQDEEEVQVKQILVKNIPEHTVITSIPGQCDIQFK